MQRMVYLQAIIMCIVSVMLYCTKISEENWDNPLDTKSDSYHVPRIDYTINDTLVSAYDTVSLWAVGVDSKSKPVAHYFWSLDSGKIWPVSLVSDSGRIAYVFPKPDSGTDSSVYNIAVRMKTVDSVGSDTEYFKVTVKLFSPSVSAGSDTSVTVGETFSLNCDASGKFMIQNYEWNIGAKGAFIKVTDGDTNIVAPATPQTITYTLRITDSRGVSATATRTVNFVPVGLVWDKSNWDEGSWK